jgi:uncharacterized protein (TIGR00251 family)
VAPQRLALREHDGGTTLKVRAAPGAARDRVAGVHGDALKIAVAAPPDRGRANERIAEVLADLVGLPRGRVMLTAGSTSRDKRFFVARMDAATLRRLLAPHLAP